MRLGVLGNGQLARMLALAAADLGITVTTGSPGGAGPASVAAGAIDLGPAWDDADGLEELIAASDVITVELEHLPAPVLDHLAAAVPLRPGAAAIRTLQDRRQERALCDGTGVPQPQWTAVERATDIDAWSAGWPAVLKRAVGGYDGRGVAFVADAQAARTAWESWDCAPAVLEAAVPFERELSVLAARGVRGDVRTWPLVENRHEQGILRTTLAPAPGVNADLQRRADNLAGAVLQKLGYVGVLAIELFEVDGRLLVNEFAPRVHNSGHWTIEGSVTSQFHQHVRAVLGLPLGDTSLRAGPVGMVNLIGEVPSTADLLAVPSAALHLYGKSPRPGRKLGHVTAPIGELDRLLEIAGSSAERGALTPR